MTRGHHWRERGREAESGELLGWADDRAIHVQESWSGLPFPAPGDLPNPGTEHKSPMSPAPAGRFFTTNAPGKSKMTQTCDFTALVGSCYKVMSLDLSIWNSTQKSRMLTSDKSGTEMWPGPEIYIWRVVRKSHPHPFIPQWESTDWGEKKA